MSAKESALNFFEAYREQNVEKMVSLCTEDASFRYVPDSVEGKVRGEGDNFWRTLIETYPDLTNKVKWTTESIDGNAILEVLISGTQTKDIGPVKNQGKHFDLLHLFILHVNDACLIDSITAFWDNVTIYRQLGHTDIS